MHFFGEDSFVADEQVIPLDDGASGRAASNPASAADINGYGNTLAHRLQDIEAPAQYRAIDRPARALDTFAASS